MRHISLIGRHLESVGRTEPVFEHNLTSIEERLTYEIHSNSGIFLFSYVNIISCNLCARVKVKGHRDIKMEENTSFGKLVQPIPIW